MKSRGIEGMVAVALLAMAGSARGGTVEALLDGVSPGRVVEVSVDNGGSWISGYAGKINWTRLGGTNSGAPGSNFSTFCVELTQDVYIGSRYTYDVVNLTQAPDSGGFGVGHGMTAESANDLRRLWGNYYDAIGNDANKAAAFQLATWEIVYDNDHMLNSNSFRYRHPGDVIAMQAQTWLDALDYNGAAPNLMALSRPGIQDQVFLAGSKGMVPLPPAALGALVPGALIAVRVWRRGRRSGGGA